MPEEPLSHDEQTISWGFSVWDAKRGLFPSRFSDLIGRMTELPPDFANVDWVFEGPAITDKGLGVLYSPFVQIGPEDFVAVDGRLLSYVRAFWAPEIGERFEIFKNVALSVPQRAAVGIGYGHDLYAELYNATMELIDEAIGRARAESVPSLTEPGYSPAYVIVAGDVLTTLAQLYVDTGSFVDDVRATMLTNTAVGQVEAFAIEAEFARPKVKGPSALSFVAIGFAGIATALIFAAVMTVKGRKRK